jgi:hypothetical protein
MASKEVFLQLQQLEQELSKLAPVVTHVTTAQKVTEMVAAIPRQHVALLDTIKESARQHNNDLLKQSGTVLTTLQHATEQVLETTRNEQVIIQGLSLDIQQYHRKIADVNFPERLDKLDATMATVMLTVQSVQNRLDNLERNLTDRVKEEALRQQQILFGQRSWLIILLILGVLTIAATVGMKFLH